MIRMTVLMFTAACMTTVGTANALTIDGFDDGTVLMGRTNTGWTPVPPNSSVTINESGLSVLGGRRDTTLTKVGGSNISPYISLSSSQISYNSTFGDDGSSMAFAYGLGGDLDLDATQFGNAFAAVGVSGDMETGPRPVDLTVTITTSGLGSSSAAIAIINGGADHLVPFASFAGSADLTDVDTIVFEFVDRVDTGGAVDYSVGGLAIVPEPATMSLLAVGALALLRRRRHA
jgi:hypothetical protein